MTTFHQKSYKKHAAQYDQTHETKNMPIASWTKENSVDAWRHRRMYQTIDPILKLHPKAKWLTVGDGRFGRDAQYIAQHDGDVLPTDISETLLKKAFESGTIQKYQVENAEALSFTDNAFDYVFCKESYHHFPRPMIGLYEMLRVAKKAVILIEPNDQIATDAPLPAILNWLKRQIRNFLRKPELRNSFETSGNYLYTVSKREMEKVALGLNLPIIAVKGINDEYLEGCETEDLAIKGPKYQKISRTIRRRDCLCRYGFLDPLLLTVIIFKSIPDQKLLASLKENGYQVIPLPENPHL